MDTQIGSSAAGIAPAARCVVVVPCYNEAARLQPLRFSEFLAEERQVDFLFVNDGSRDATLSVLETLRAKHPDRIQVLDKQPNGGHGVLGCRPGNTVKCDSSPAQPVDRTP
jgi:cellulose synthase/poly-beta-1,6-N-acetylglucosamine synthase-like glycosyltransferase